MDQEQGAGGSAEDAGSAPQVAAAEIARMPPALARGRDTRRSTARPRVAATEIQGLETLFASGPVSTPDRLVLMRRLAEDYAELERSARGEPYLEARSRIQAISTSRCFDKEAS